MGADLPWGLAFVVSLYALSAAYLLIAAGRSSAKDRGRGQRDAFFVLVVPALNEEVVIANTVRHLLALRGDNYLVLVVDDGSDDGTARVVSGFSPERVRLLSRQLPLARTGKGDVLNQAYRAIVASELPELYGEDHVIMVVMDADGQVEPEMLQVVEPYFADPKVGAVQVGVRMMNATQNLVTRWQQYEFVTFNWIFSRARDTLGSASLGGNGQFVRLSALTSLEEGPWTDCLTEDLDIGLRMALRGWRNAYCHDTRVSQQAVSSLKRLVRQRSRWFQGHLSCIKHAPAVLASDMSSAAKTDILHYLLAPALFLPLGFVSVASFVYMLVGMASHFFSDIPIELSTEPTVWIVSFVAGLGLIPVYALALWRAGESGFWRGLVWAHLYTVGSYIWLVAGVLAVRNMIRGRGGWLKTARQAVGGPAEGVAAIGSRERPVVAGSSVRLHRRSGALPAVRGENFASRAERGIDERAPGYIGPSAPASVVSTSLLLARGEAHRVELQRILKRAGIIAGDGDAKRSSIAT